MTRVYTLKRIKKKRPRKKPDQIKLNSDQTVQETLEFLENSSTRNKGVKE